VLFTTQDRGREKAFLVAHGFPCARHAIIRRRGELPQAAATVGFPSVLKTTAFGYDGKGQRKVGSAAELEAAFDDLGGQETVLEEWLEFDCELSVVAARGQDGAIAAFAPSRNEHANHILDVAVAPSGLAEPQVRGAREIAERVLDALGVVGTACVEMFLARDGRLLVNEIAPRPHNSGHLTIDACETSQFEQQVRALCGLPLGSPRQVAPAAMVNLLGDCWERGEPDWAAALGVPGVRLSLYGTSDPRPGRKMGHLTALAATAEEAVERAVLARRVSSAGRASGPSSSC
jgi:5-(carboxyamino)imidazole ribonucleotide synthase